MSGATFQRAPVRYVRSPPSERERPVYGVSSPGPHDGSHPVAELRLDPCPRLEVLIARQARRILKRPQPLHPA